VSGAGLLPNTVYALEHCTTTGTSCQPANGFSTGQVSVATDRAGKFSLFVLTLTENIGPSRLFSCYPAACAIGAIPSGSSTPAVLQPISFATPTITVSPSIGLSDEEQVTVNGRDFAYNSSASVFECAVSNHDECANLPNAGGGATDGSGAFTFTFPVSQTIKGLLFCGTTQCELTAQSLGDPVATAPINFSGSPPPPNNPTISLEPSGPTVFAGGVTASGAGYPPGLAVSMCEAVANPQGTSDCLTSPDSVVADGNGAFQLFVFSLVLQGQTASGATADCTVAGNCVIATFPGYQADPPPPSSPYQTTPIVVTPFP
jgi:hypothetical protein